MLETMCCEFKAYYNEVMASLETDEAMRQEQRFFDQHQRKTMEFVDLLWDLLAAPQLSVPAQSFVNDRLVDRQLDLLGDSVRAIKRVVDSPDLVNAHVLTNHMDEIKSLKGELQGI